MACAIRPLSVTHVNAVVDDFDGAVAHLARCYGAELFMDLPQAEWHAGLLDIGRAVVELFVPPAILLGARYGPHWLGVEYQADIADVRAALAERGIRIARDVGVALHTHPADCFGVALEFYDGTFVDREWPLLGGRMLRSAEDWASGPLGLAGLVGFQVAVHDLDGATAFFESLLSGERLYELERPAIAARARGVRIADAIVEIATPTGEGALAAHLHRYGDGIRSVTFRVRDLDKAMRHLRGRGLTLGPGSAPGRIAVLPQDNLGLIFEFAA